MNIVEGF